MLAQLPRIAVGGMSEPSPDSLLYLFPYHAATRVAGLHSAHSPAEADDTGAHQPDTIGKDPPAQKRDSVRDPVSAGLAGIEVQPEIPGSARDAPRGRETAPPRSGGVWDPEC